ncbi:MAG: hypothetical protein KY464_02345 [Gemmatimonadetes bacterium]|nr:hypothetical protein [Gemmatimonadota bacterium]
MAHHRFRGALTGAILSVSALAGSGCAPNAATAMPGMQMDRGSVQRAMTGWDPAAQEAATFMMGKYGPPASMTADMMVWNRTGPWKRTIIYREAVPHSFPMAHPDVMEQFIDYRAPLDRYDELAMYDGSVIVERTKGEMSARCDKEGANFLALNLAHEIATAGRTPEDARRMYGEQIKLMKAGQMTPYTSGLMFAPPTSGNDPDRPIM